MRIVAPIQKKIKKKEEEKQFKTSLRTREKILLMQKERKTVEALLPQVQSGTKRKKDTL